MLRTKSHDSSRQHELNSRTSGRESVMNGINEGKVYMIVSEFRVLSRALTNESNSHLCILSIEEFC
jgi:hypothetical protein